jgi:hypothetical protein
MVTSFKLDLLRNGIESPISKPMIISPKKEDEEEAVSL